MLKYSFLPLAVSEKQLRVCGVHPLLKCSENHIQTGPCCHDVSSATPASPTSATCNGSTGNMKAVSPLGNSGQECPALEGVGRRPGKEHPCAGTASKAVPHSLCNPVAHTESNQTSKRPSKGFHCPLSGCHSPRNPGFFHAPTQPGNRVRTCPFCERRWLWRYPELQEM